MKKGKSKLKGFISGGLIFAGLVVLPFIESSSAKNLLEDKTAEQIREEYGKIPVSFEENRGQFPEHVRFVAQGGAGWRSHRLRRRSPPLERFGGARMLGG